MTKEYLGNGVYADFNEELDQLVLTTDQYPSSTIFLDPRVVSNLIKYLKRQSDDNTTYGELVGM